MKKLFALTLCIITVLSLISCTTNNTNPGKDYSAFAGIVADPVSWYEAFQKLPVANANMTTDELRQLCVNTMKANLTFVWTPTQPIVYTYSLTGTNRDITIPTGIAYSGLCYATGIEGASTGNIHKALSYYDKATGALDIEAMGNNVLGIITSNCTFACLQGWNRVINSHTITSMRTYNKTDGNIVPVGPYTYAPYMYDFNFGSTKATTQIIQANGEQTMYESYAAMLPADGLFSSPSWHVQMCSIAPVVVRNPDGTIDPVQSYLYVCEQRTEGTRGQVDAIQQSNGADLRPLGSIDNKVTFRAMLKSGYIPFTFKEFLGQDPIEPGKAWIGSEASPLANGTDISLNDLSKKRIQANYTINNIIVAVKNKSGKTLYSYDPSVSTAPSTRDVSLLNRLQEEAFAPYSNGKNTVHIMVQLANGELLDIFHTVLKVD